jgi:putative Mg2+ transporter-C (MgtC) family protein
MAPAHGWYAHKCPGGSRSGSLRDVRSAARQRLFRTRAHRLLCSFRRRFPGRAGVIFKDGANVRGLNTAATIWCSAAIGALSGLGALKLALILAAAVLATNMVLRPLAYRIHPALPEAIPIETLYEVRLLCKIPVAAHIRTLLLSTISHLPVTLQSVRGEQDDANNQAQITAGMRTVGRNNEAIEQVVMRLSIEEEVSNISWSIVEAAME